MCTKEEREGRGFSWFSVQYSRYTGTVWVDGGVCVVVRQETPR